MVGIDIRTQSGLLIVAPVGDVDLTNAEDLRNAVLAAMTNDRAVVVVDLTRTDYLDSAGIRALFSVARRLEERRRQFALVASPRSHIRRLLGIVDFESHARVYDSVDSARADLQD